MSIERDWIMRATSDVNCRETQLADVISHLPPLVRVPSISTARDGANFALLMHDISDDLIPPDLPTITEQQLDGILKAIAQLHAAPADAISVSWCGLRERLMLLTPGTALVAENYGAHVARDIIGGWTAFDRHAPPAAVALMRELFDDPASLLGALGALPPAFLHGDLKLDNIGLDQDGAMWLIDWAMTLVAPAAVDLGWFLAINSRRLPVALDDVIARYAAAASVPSAVRIRHDALTVICGLLLRGWRKALDAEAGEPAELRWWCERAVAASRFL